MNPVATRRAADGLLPYPPGGRQATKNDILNIAWMLGMALDEQAPVGELVSALLKRAQFMHATLTRVRDLSSDGVLRDLAALIIGKETDTFSVIAITKESPTP